MTLAEAIASANQIIGNITHNALANGVAVMNSAMPTSSHVSEAAKWVLVADANQTLVQPTIEAEICKMSAANLDNAARAAFSPKMRIEDAVLVALGRRAAWEMFGMSSANVIPSESVTLTPAEAANAVHADHSGLVETMLRTYAPFSTRLVGIAWYNSLSFETHNHHHLPQKTKKLSSTTITLLGLKDYFTEGAGHTPSAESVVMHDMFHPLSYDLKAKLARNATFAKALPDIGFGNLAKRIPVKAADCGMAFNYPTLWATADQYSRNADDLPAELVPPETLTIAIETYAAATDQTAATQATAELRAMAPHLGIASAYLAGFILGKERKTTGERDAELSDYSGRITILGSPALRRSTGEFPGAFQLGITRGYAAVTGWGSDNRVKHTFALIKKATRAAVTAHTAAVAARAVPRAAVPAVP